MDRRTLVYTPRAQRDLRELDRRYALQILEDLPILETPPWPAGKEKRLRGFSYWEIKTGDFRTLFLPEGKTIIILRIVNCRDLALAVKRIDFRALLQWLHGIYER